MTKLLIIGLDGATFDVISPLIKKGELPTIKKLMDNGKHGILKAAHPPSTFPGWPTIATGKNPGEHGIIGFFNPKKRKPLVNKRIRTVDLNYISKQMRKAEPFWETLNKKGYSVGLINYPGTYPPHKIDGIMVTGVLTPSTQKYTYPDILKHEIKHIVGKYEIDPKFLADKKNDLQQANNIARKRGKVAEYFLKNCNFDVFCVVFTCIDRIQHYYWGQIEVEEHWKEIDKILAKIIDCVEKDTNILIVSDHGFQANDTYFNVNTWLIKNKYLTIKSSSFINAIMRKFGMHTTNILKFIKFFRLTFLLSKLPIKIRGLFAEKRVTFEEANIDWNRTLAYSTSDAENGIYLNVKNREPYGVIDNNDKKAMIKLIMRNLQKLDIDIDVFRREEIYSGEYLDVLPDLMLYINTKGYRVSTHIDPETFSKVDHSEIESPLGRHHVDGIYIAKGNEISGFFDGQEKNQDKIKETIINTIEKIK